MRAASPAFFAAGLAAAAAAWFGLFFAQLGMPTRGSTWIHELIDAKERFASTLQGPRLLVVGGSGTLYSLRARDLSRQLGVPVVNAGLHAGLGREYILREARRLARPGDTVVLALEYELLISDKLGPVLVDYLAAWDPGYFRALGAQEQLRAVLGMPFSRLANPFLLRTFHAYPPYPFYVDREGDGMSNNSVMKTDLMLPNIERAWPAIRPPSAAARTELRAFAEWARAHQVRVLAVHPQSAFFPFYLEDPAYDRAFDAIARCYAAIGVPLLDRPLDSLMDRGLFFDSVYHASDLGAAIRTRELAERLRPHVSGRTWGALPPPAPRPDHPLEAIDANFHRFEPLERFGPVQGIDPPLPEPFIAALPPRSKAVIRTLGAGPAHLVARVKGTRPGQTVEVAIDGVAVGTWPLDASEFRRFEADVELRAGANALTLTQSGAPGPVDIAQWRVDLADEHTRSADAR